jgi:hypothetical protein
VLAGALIECWTYVMQRPAQREAVRAPALPAPSARPEHNRTAERLQLLRDLPFQVLRTVSINSDKNAITVLAYRLLGGGSDGRGASWIRTRLPADLPLVVAS